MTILTRRSAVRLLVGAPALVLGRGTANSLGRPSPPAGSRINQIIVVCKTHFDIGYSDRVADVLTFYRTTMIDRALDLIDKSRALPPEEQFIWTCPGWVFERIVEDWPGQTAERRQRLDRAVSGWPTCCSRAAFQHRERVDVARRVCARLHICRSFLSAIWPADIARGENIRRAFSIESAGGGTGARRNQVYAHWV